MNDKPFTYFSTFTGIGGFEIGIHNAYRATVRGSEVDSPKSISLWSRLFPTTRKGARSTKGSASERGDDQSEQRPLCVGYSEIDKFATSVYEKNFKGVKNYGDITKINAEELPDFDCLVGGFPCQAFSIAGKRQGFADTRGTLFFDLARILEAKQPRLFVFENVKGLLNHDGGNTIKTIISACDELGYDLQWQVLNSKNFGVPQNRERIIIVGHLRGSTRPEVFPITGSNANHIREITKSVPQAQRVYDESGIAPSVDTGQGGNRQAKLLVPEATKKGYAEAGPGDAININQPNSKTRRGRVSKISPTLDTRPEIVTLMEDYRIRKLTPLECERLQAFPDNWTEFGVVNGEEVTISDTQRYKMAGNAVTTNVVQAVFERIFATTGVL